MANLSRLVRQVSEALGSAATAERVESISRIVLDELAFLSHAESAAQPESRSDEVRDRIVVLAIGAARPGLRDALSDTLKDSGCSALSVASSDSDTKTLILRASSPGPHVSLHELGQRVDAVAARHGTRAGVLHELLFAALNGPLG